MYNDHLLIQTLSLIMQCVNYRVHSSRAVTITTFVVRYIAPKLIAINEIVILRPFYATDFIMTV